MGDAEARWQRLWAFKATWRLIVLYLVCGDRLVYSVVIPPEKTIVM